MSVRLVVLRTRDRGRKLDDRDLHQQRPIEGELECFTADEGSCGA